eukprot:TRINITY_DN10819_c0_g1_i1.p1 TRINITY_DN10819_c0_g1~~TRINITY_DN10819_c0_g1_i1.p1  ORF type:complete len:440 (+),score=73.04 TRINITY_DN10819_c0_g1_i1:172-1491(+)
MNDELFETCKDLVTPTYISQAQDGRNQRTKRLRKLLHQRQIPQEGWDDLTIQYLLNELSMMDSNNFIENAGLGEREGRIYSGLVASRHYHLVHGIGRSGDIAAVQPKAAGSSVMYQLTNKLALSLVKRSGVSLAKSAIVLPLATGMSIGMCLLTLKEEKPDARYVIWPRIDQKACLKAIFSMGFEPLVVENILEGDQLVTDLERIKELIAEYGSDSILCVLSTTSCFAPRAYDKIVEIGSICKEYDLFHLVNNAYGLQDTHCTALLNEAISKGTVDFFVQSTDKNIMVPVGGAIVASPNKQRISSLSQIYPGRASNGPILDVFITLLSMGLDGWQDLRDKREQNYFYLKEKMNEVAQRFGTRLLKVPGNHISMGLALDFPDFTGDISSLGSKLFLRGCSGMRVVNPANSIKTIKGMTFQSYGAHMDDYPVPYLTVAAAI